MPDLTNYEYDIFLSHNHRDQEWTTKLAEHLEQEGWKGRKLKVFFSPWDIRPGQSIPKEIERALPKSRKVGLVLSPDAMASAWVELERLVTTYIDISERDERLIPLLRKECDIPALLKPILSIDFSDDDAFNDSYRTLLTVIKDEPLPRGSHVSVANAKILSPLIPRPPIVGFVARRDSEGHDIVERLKEELAPERDQLVVLHGPGGVGKTTLAAETARSLSGVFGGRIAWISADGRQAFALSTLLDDTATQLGRDDLRALRPDQKAVAVAGLLAAERTLVVLDNFETIAADEQTRCVEFLSKHATCPALITTRQRIGSVRNITIPVMDSAEAEEFLKLLIAETSDPSAFAQVDLERVKQVSERNPLVMQWVVAQIDLAQEAHTVLNELTHGVGDAAQCVFDRSFELSYLGDDGRAVLLALSLFVPDASRGALTEVSGFGEDLKRLNEAVKRMASLSLVKTTAGGSRLIIEGLTRELAKIRLPKAENAAEFRQRFVAHFLSYAEAYGRPEVENFDQLEAEKDNEFSSMELAFELGDWQSVTRMMDALSFDGARGFLSMRGYWEEAVRLGKQALEAARNLSSEVEVARFSHNLGITCQYRGDLEKARRLYSESLGIAKKLGNQSGVAITLHELGRLAHDQGELEESRNLYNQSLEISKKLGHQIGIAITLHQLAMLTLDQGEIEEARHLYNQSLEIARKLGNQEGIAGTLHELGRLSQAQGETEEARQFYNQSLDISKKLGNQRGIAFTLHELGRLTQTQGELDEARQLYNQSLEIKRKLGSQSGIANTLHQLGTVSEEQGDKEQATRLFREALAIYEKLGSPDAEIARQSLARIEGESS
jgi:tetratricopeptide (TPR) repeat protein